MAAQSFGSWKFWKQGTSINSFIDKDRKLERHLSMDCRHQNCIFNKFLRLQTKKSSSGSIPKTNENWKRNTLSYASKIR